MKKYLFPLILCLLFSCSKNKNSSNLIDAIPLNIQTVSLPSSQTHGPNSTWWGYHMSKVVRDGDVVYVGIVENDTGSSTVKADYNVYKIDPNGNKTKIGTHQASRPGNILVSSTGALHVFTFDPIDPTINDSIGNLVYHYYPNARSDDFSATSEIIKSAPNAYSETVNIRIGATINEDDTLAVAYGLNYEQTSSSKSMVVYTKSAGGNWIENIYPNLLHEYYYPYIILTKLNKLFILPVQDDYVAGPIPFNRYYKSPLLKFDGVSWSQEMVLDLSAHPSAINDENPYLVEQTELFELSNGMMIAIVIDKSLGWSDFKFKMMTLDSSGNKLSLDYLTWPENKNLRWIRAFEIDGDLYFFGVSGDGEAYFVQHTSSKIVRVNISGLDQTYVYLSSVRGGSHQDHDYLDILAVSGDSEAYPSPGMKLHKISKSDIKALFL